MLQVIASFRYIQAKPGRLFHSVQELPPFNGQFRNRTVCGLSIVDWPSPIEGARTGPLCLRCKTGTSTKKHKCPDCGHEHSVQGSRKKLWERFKDHLRSHDHLSDTTTVELGRLVEKYYV